MSNQPQARVADERAAFEAARAAGAFKPANAVCPTWYATELRFEGWQAASARRAAGAPAETPKAVDVCAEMRALCSACGGTGDVHSITGEWHGACDCEASAWSRAPQIDAITRPSTLAEQIASAQAVVATWSPEMRAAVQLEGGGVAPATAPDVAKPATFQRGDIVRKKSGSEWEGRHCRHLLHHPDARRVCSREQRACRVCADLSGRGAGTGQIERITVNHHQANELLPCAHCGGPARYLERNPGFWDERAVCDGCKYSLPPAAWNRRAAPTEPAVDRDASWGRVDVVADLVRNLLTLDQTLPIYAGLHVTIDGKRRHRTRPVSTSYERIIDGKWIDPSRKDVPYGVIVWAGPAADPEPITPPSPSVDQAKRLVGGEVAASPWISVHDRLPEHRQTVAFVVDTEDWSRMSHLNGRVLGGQYDESSGNFSVPGLGMLATHWMPLPSPPDRASTGSATSTEKDANNGSH